MKLRREMRPSTDDASEVIHAALRLAAQAHGDYEATELRGVYDPEWPGWYADHMARSLRDAGYQVVEVSR